MFCLFYHIDAEEVIFRNLELICYFKAAKQKADFSLTDESGLNQIFIHMTVILGSANRIYFTVMSRVFL
ncbi:unnamed protein product [Heterobilharzia americana]|nr:unnamed protein product [Heterobilharzia americana]